MDGWAREGSWCLLDATWLRLSGASSNPRALPKGFGVGAALSLPSLSPFLSPYCFL